MGRIDDTVTDENGEELVNAPPELLDKYPTPTLAETDEEEGGAMETTSGEGGDGAEEYSWNCGTPGYGEP